MGFFFLLRRQHSDTTNDVQQSGQACVVSSNPGSNDGLCCVDAIQKDVRDDHQFPGPSPAADDADVVRRDSGTVSCYLL